jgi:hypothetical protein
MEKFHFNDTSLYIFACVKAAKSHKSQLPVVDNNIDIPSNQDYCGQHLLTVTK